ncbi:unnamed protein product [Effrenium voratum]|nr:unnamed protein product [Effrenium voratum]
MQALIRDIRVATIDHYRDSDRPLVSVSVPPQEITTGTVQLIVTVFRLGDVATDGNGWTSAEHVLETVRAEKGEEVDAGQLLEDLNWLNLNPYRNVAAVFEPGQKAGETILTLRSREVKPWQAYLGYQNSGLESSDTNRIIAGFNLANIPATDHLLSYQLTTSPDFWWKDGLFGDVGNADYIAHSGNYFVPLRWRHKLTLQASYIDSNATLTTPFTQAGKTYQAYLEYALPIMTAGDLRYDIYGGAEWKRQETDVSFAGTLVRNTTLDIAQFIAGVRGSVSDTYGATGFDLRVVASPGDLTGNNDDANFVTVTGNPNASADYLYLYGSAQRTTPIETLDSSLNSNLRAQFGEDLAGLEQLAIGGRNTVRGYSELEAAGNFGFSLSNELRLPPLFPLIDVDAGVQDRLVPFLFADAGYVEDDFANTEDWLVGTGLGADYAVTDYISLSGALGVALSKTLETEASRGFGLMIAAALGFTAPVPVMAAQTLTQITHGDWLLVCNQAEEDADEQCALTHSVVAPQNKVQLLGLALTYDKVVDTYPAQFTVPLGGALGPGFLLEVEGQELLAMPFARCDANGCYVEQVLAREVVELLAEGVTVTFADRLGQPLAITLSSNGVASGLADLEDRAITWCRAN